MSKDIIASFHYNLEALKLDYKTTSDALRNWPGGDPNEQEFLERKKLELFRVLMDHGYAASNNSN